MKKKMIIIFGGSGFLGRHLVELFSSQDETIHIANADLLAPQIQFKQEFLFDIDVRRLTNETQLPESTDCIINLAAIHKSPGHAAHEYFETNILGAKNVCDFAEKINCKKIIFTSSIAPYGPGEDEKTEASITMPSIPYGISKIIAEGIHKEWMYRGEGRQLSILRPGVIFGKGENGNFTRMATALRNGVFVYPGRKDTIKACIYVKDACRIIDFAMQSTQQFSLYNVCYPNKISTEDIATAFHESLNYKLPKYVLPKYVIDLGAAVLRLINTPSIRSLGLDPARIEKLVNSTNISSKKLVDAGFEFKYDLVSAIKDWSKDCGGEKLF